MITLSLFFKQYIYFMYILRITYFVYFYVQKKFVMMINHSGKIVEYGVAGLQKELIYLDAKNVLYTKS